MRRRVALIVGLAMSLAWGGLSQLGVAQNSPIPLAKKTPGTAAGGSTPGSAVVKKTPGTGSGSTGRNPLVDRTFPPNDYFLVRDELNEGEYDAALKDFRATWRTAIRDIDGRWIDSICHYTMIGETLYRKGYTAEALESYTEAVKLFIAYAPWMMRVEFSDVQGSTASIVTQPIPWGRSARKTRPGVVAEKMSIGVGRLVTEADIRKGGAIQLPSIRSIRPAEIVRCTTLAISRRREILGPLCKHDAITAQLFKAFGTTLSPARHWSEAWINLQLGVTYASVDQTAQAIEALKKALVLGGQFDHALTCLALLELGKLHFELGKLDEAATLFQEATYAAYYYRELDALEESLRLGTITHLVSNKKDVYPPLTTVIPWARQKQYRELEISARLMLAESLAARGNVKDAKQALADARAAIGSRRMLPSRIGSRLDYLAAQTFYQSQNRRDGDKALEAAIKFQRVASQRLLQISLVEKVAARLTPLRSVGLYAQVLADPTSNHWAADPLEAMAVMSTPHGGPFERWFEAALAAQQHEEAFDIADITRRHRFLSTLPLGGRVHALRWLLEGSEDVLDKTTTLQRQDLIGRYPKYAELSKQSAALRAEVKANPLNPADNDGQQKLRERLRKLATLSEQQEVILHDMALRREGMPMLFPPLKKWADIQKALPPGQALWTFFATANQVHCFMLNSQQYDHWSLAP